MANRSRPSLKSFLGLIFVALLLTLADLLLTWKLIHSGNGHVIEGNPLANWWLVKYGWQGMTAFKLGMFLVMGSLVGLIAYKRPLLGEKVLVFGCGALSAVVLSSVFLTGSVQKLDDEPMCEVSWATYLTLEPALGTSAARSSHASPPEGDLFLLLTEKSVQQELHLSDSYVVRVLRLADSRLEIPQQFHLLSLVEKTTRAREQLAQQSALLEDLEPEQLERLRQIAWQQRGHLAFGEPEVGAALQLTAHQKNAMLTIMEDVRKAQEAPPRPRGFFGAPPRRPEDDAARIMRRLVAVLTPDQQARWKEMTGVPFKGEITFGKPRPSPEPGRYPRAAQ